MFEGIKKWFAVRNYANGLGQDLKKRYGRQSNYTPEQVRRTAIDGGYNMDYLCFAMCMYCNAADFTRYHEETGETCDYSAMRGAVADRFYGGDASFTCDTVFESDSNDFGTSAGGSDAADAGCSGGDSGGGDGGGGGD